jgi:XTP/dITP diphosphohydrolase
MKLVLATTNRNKVLEIKDKFSGIGSLEILSLSSPEFSGAPEIVEDGLTFEENALKKAMAIAAFTGLVSMADDSGLCVDALDGRPGIYSARYGGEGATDRDRYLKLLDEMKGIGKRSARFVCAIAIAFPGGESRVVTGECGGIIAREPAGEKGFGYDPVFFLPEYGKTMAELPLEEKNRISHRALALEKAARIFEDMN